MKSRKVPFIQLSEKKAAIEYRPHSHHELFLQDDRFDFQYSAMLFCENKLENVRRTIFQRCFENSFNQVVNICKFHNENGKLPLKLLHLQSELSPLDSSFLAMHLASNIKLHNFDECLLIAKIDDENVTFNSIVSNIATQLTEDPKLAPAIRIYPNSVESSILERNKLWKPECYLTKLMELLDEFRTTNASTLQDSQQTMVVILPPLENLAYGTIEQLVSYLNEQKWKTLLVILAREMSMAKVLWNDDLNYSIQLSRVTLSTPLHLYDYVMEVVLLNNDFPVHLNGAILAKVHEEFMNYQICVTSLFHRLSNFLTLHFRNAKSLLCMCKEWDWLQMITIYIRSYSARQQFSTCDSKANRLELKEHVNKSLIGLVEFINLFELNDILRIIYPGTIFKKNTEPIVIQTLEYLIFSHWNKRLVCKMIYTILQIMRDYLLTPEQKLQFGNCEILIAIMNSTDTTVHETLMSLLSSIEQQLPTVSCARVKSMLMTIMKELETFQSSLIPVDFKEATVPKEIKRMHLEAIEDVYSFIFQQLAMLEYLLGSISSTFFVDEDCYLMEISHRRMKALTTEQHRELRLQRAADLGSEKDRATLLEMSSTAKDGMTYYGEMLNDCIQWMKGMIEQYRNLYPLEIMLQDFFVIQKDAYPSFPTTTVLGNENIRRNYVQAIREPIVYSSSKRSESKVATTQSSSSSAASSSSSSSEHKNKHQPGVSYLVNRIDTASMSETSNKWFDVFAEGWLEERPNVKRLFPTAETLLQAKKPKATIGNNSKDKGTDNNVANEVIQSFAKNEFAHAIYDLEKSGIILAKGTEQGTVVIAKKIYTGI